MAQKFPDYPLVGDVVYYFDDNRRPCAAIVAWVHDRVLKGTRRPICNLTIFKQNGKVACREEVTPATFDNSTGVWKITEKWAWPDEVPIKVFNTSPSSELRARRFGAGETIVP